MQSFTEADLPVQLRALQAMLGAHIDPLIVAIRNQHPVVGRAALLYLLSVLFTTQTPTVLNVDAKELERLRLVFVPLHPHACAYVEGSLEAEKFVRLAEELDFLA